MGAKQAQLTDTRFAETDGDLPPAPDRVDDPTPRQQEQLAERARAHAEAVVEREGYEDVIDPAADITWKTSTNSQRTRRAGNCEAEIRGREVQSLTITLTWAAYAAWGWEEFSGTVRHELAHAIDFCQRGTSDHGYRFEILAEDIGASIECRPFVENPRLIVECPEGCEDYRSQASKLVKDPPVCADHQAQFEITHTESGRSWTTPEGYQEARTAIEADPEVEW